jgi:hypothetical protein
MPDYSNAKIYRIVPKTGREDGDVYFGSTTQKLECRLHCHRSAFYTNNSKLSSRFLFYKYGEDGVKIELVETYPVECKKELLLRERFYIENNQCVNLYIPGRDNTEWYQCNRERRIEQSREYHKNNLEKCKASSAAYYAANKDDINRKTREVYAANKDEITRKMRERYVANKDEINRKMRERYAANKDEITRKMRDVYAAKKAARIDLAKTPEL